MTHKYKDRVALCYIVDDDVNAWMKQYAQQHYMSYSKVLFFALREKYERELKAKNTQDSQIDTPVNVIGQEEGD